MAEKSRLTLELPVFVRDQMEDLRRRTGAESVTEVIRRAVALYWDLTVRGGRLVVKYNDGREETLIIV